MKKIIILIVMIFVTNIYSQDSLNINLKNLAVSASESFNQAQLMSAAGMAERILSHQKDNLFARYYRTFVQYIQIQNGVRTLEKPKILAMIDACTENANILADSKEWECEANIILASVNMMKISVKPEAAQEIFMKIYDYLGRAEKADPENPRLHLTKGIMTLNTPEMFGGGIKNAMPILQKAFELNSARKKGNVEWGYLEACAWLGQAYARANEIEKAKEIYNKALEVNPDYVWIKRVLLPQLENKK